MIHSILSKYGRRGSLLFLFGGGWICYGFSFWTSLPYRFGHMGATIGHVLNSHWLGWAWVLSGVIAVLVALTTSRLSDTAGFVALIVPCVAWIGLDIISGTLALFTDAYGESSAWLSLLTWIFRAGAVLVTASVVDTRDSP